MSEITRHILSLNPVLLYRENATGRTPLEMAREMYITSCVSEPISISITHHPQFITEYDPSYFLPKTETDENSRKSTKRVYDICLEADQKMEPSQKKRHLVSLLEANEVAERVTGLSSRYGGSQVVVNGGAVDEEVRFDVLGELGYKFY